MQTEFLQNSGANELLNLAFMGGQISAASVSSEKLNLLLASLETGQSIQGKVLEKNGSEVKILLSDEMTLLAHLEGFAGVEIGKMMTLEVQSNRNGALLLRPLFSNLSSDENVTKALNAAGIPLNERTVAMTEEMMKQGLSIGKDSLIDSFRDTVRFKDTDPTVLVDMKKLGIPIEENNVEQFSAYKDLKHQILFEFDRLSDSLGNEIEALVKQGDFDSVFDLLRSFDDFFSQEKISFDSPESIVSQNSEASESIPQTIEEYQVTENLPVSENAPISEDEPLKGNVLLKKDMIGPELASLTEEAESTPPKKLSDTFERLFESIIKEPKESKARVSTFIKQNVEDAYLLSPDEVKNKENVKELYLKLYERVRHLEENIPSSSLKDNSIQQTISQIRGNLDFMNQMNQAFTYVQLPLKFSESKAHGDLYVYSNKQKGIGKDGSVSAFLHLDMEHLGPVDIYVSMKENRVNTSFKLKDEEMLSFIEEHMDILNARLEKLGYSLNVTCSVNQEQFNVVDEMMREKPGMVTVSHQAFDVRT